MQGQHQPAISRLIKEMEAVVGVTRPSYCESMGVNLILEY